MAVKLIKEVVAYLTTNPKLSTAERLVLMLIAERARVVTRDAYSGEDGWNLAQAAGMPPTTLRSVLQRLAAHGIEVRVAWSTDSNGRPVYASWRRQTTYRLPCLLGDEWSSPSEEDEPDESDPVGDEQPSPTAELVGDERSSVGDDQPSIGDERSSPYPRETKNKPKPSSLDLRTNVARTRAAEDPISSRGLGPSRAITLRVIPGTKPPTQRVATQPSLWPAAAPTEVDVKAAEARQMARTAIADARRHHRANLARTAPQRVPGPSVGAVQRKPGPQCASCDTELDPDGTCFVCRDGRIQTA